MKFRPIAGIDVGKYFSEMAILSPSNEVVARMKIHHDSITDVERAVELLKKTEKDFASRPFVVMESTGHYHKILFYSLHIFQKFFYNNFLTFISWSSFSLREQGDLEVEEFLP